MNDDPLMQRFFHELQQTTASLGLSAVALSALTASAQRQGAQQATLESLASSAWRFSLAAALLALLAISYAIITGAQLSEASQRVSGILL